MADDNTWIVDSIVQFMQCPEWIVPVHQYIDTQCIQFDTEEESRLEFTEIHNNFRKLCEDLLEGFLKEIGIPLDVFLSICAAAARDPTHPHNLNATQVMSYLLAFDDYESFKMLMEKRNVMLELEVMQEMAGLPPPPEPEVDEEEDELRMAIEASLRDYEATQRKAKEVDEAELKAALKLSEDIARIPQLAPSVQEKLKSVPKPEPTPEKKKPAEPDHPEAKVHAPLDASRPLENAVKPILGSLAGVPNKPTFGPQRAVLPGIGNGNAGLRATPSQQQNVTPPVEQKKAPAPDAPQATAPQMSAEEMKQRAEYMRAQKERIVKGRNQQRQEELQVYTEAQKENKMAEPSQEEIEAQKQRIAVARRFREDLIEETKRAARGEQ